jgi:hypothetical protein
LKERGVGKGIEQGNDKRNRKRKIKVVLLIEDVVV